MHAFNELIDRADEVVSVPDPKDVRIRDPEVYLKRLSDLQTPHQRLAHFLKSVVLFDPDPTHESVWVKKMFIAGAAFGWLFGGLANSSHYHQDYIRRHNAAVFEGRYRAARHLNDSYIYNFITKGTKYGVRTSLLAASVGIISLGSINCRNQLFLPDWIIGFGALGAISRSWLGMRAMAVGGLLGASAGLFGFGLAKSFEMLSGVSVAQMRYLHHTDYMRKREARLDSLRRTREWYEKDTKRVPS